MLSDVNILITYDVNILSTCLELSERVIKSETFNHLFAYNYFLRRWMFADFGYDSDNYICVHLILSFYKCILSIECTT